MRIWKRFVAANWPLRLWMGGCVLAWAAFVKLELAPDRTLFASWKELAVFSGLALATLIITVLTAGIMSMIVVGPIYRFQAHINGAPFKPGDHVRILAGRFRGRVTRVYSGWQGDTVRLDLGDEAKDKFKDIFGQGEVERAE